MKDVRVLALLVAMAPLAAQAIPVQSGVGTLLTARTCIAGPDGACEFLSPIQQSLYAGTPGGAAFSAAASFTGYGTASSSGGLIGSSGTPELTTFAQAGSGFRVNTNSFSLQRYE